MRGAYIVRMVVRSWILALTSLAALATAARADDPPGERAPGLQGETAHPPVVVRAPMPERLDQRAAVRGCPVGGGCRPWRDELREFELEAFSTATGPWIDPVLRPSQRAARPTDLRPDLPWLADLELPDLPMTWDQRVIDYLVFYKDDPRGRRIMRGWLEAQGRYRDLILTALRRAHLPEDLLYVAMIESSYDSTDRSRVGASGLWQFMPDGGRIYGLAIDRWIDERNDPVRATEAAVGYWTDLHQRFGNWDLAMAAYNAGYGAVLKGIARYNTNDFWALLAYENALPWESSIYVPKALAAAIVGHNLAAFGFADVDLGKPERWDDVTVPSSIALPAIARAAGCDVAALKRLNPHLRRGRTPAGKSFIVRVPAGGGASFAAKLGQTRGDWDDVDSYVVRYGERFEDIATQFGIAKQKLRALNEIEHESDVGGGSLILVPRVSDSKRKQNLAAAADELYGSGVDHRPGEALIVPVPDPAAAIADRRRIFYRVVIGDSLPVVARALGVGAGELATWNGLDAAAALHPRMVLEAWVPTAWSEDRANVALLDESRLVIVKRGSKEHLELSEGRSGRVRTEYKAAKRESFEQIGKKFGLGKRDLARINRKSPETMVDKGETVIVYIVVDHTRSDRAAKQWKQTPKPARKKKGPKPPAGKVSDASGDDASDDDAPDDDSSDDDSAAAKPAVVASKPAAAKPVAVASNTVASKPAAAKPVAVASKPADAKPATVASKPAAAKPAEVAAASSDGPVTSPE